MSIRIIRNGKRVDRLYRLQQLQKKMMLGLGLVAFTLIALMVARSMPLLLQVWGI